MVYLAATTVISVFVIPENATSTGRGFLKDYSYLQSARPLFIFRVCASVWLQIHDLGNPAAAMTHLSEAAGPAIYVYGNR